MRQEVFFAGDVGRSTLEREHSLGVRCFKVWTFEAVGGQLKSEQIGQIVDDCLREARCCGRVVLNQLALADRKD